MPYPIGIHYCLSEGKHKPVILKSHALQVYMERDGMSYEDAVEFWEYNMEGSDTNLIAVDDTLTQEEIAEMLYGEKDD